GGEVGTAEGEVRTGGGPAPDPPGYDLRGVVVGSEGTVGVVTKAIVRLMRNPPAVRTMLLDFASLHQAAACVSGIIASGVVPAAIEMMTPNLTLAAQAS